MNPSQKKNKFKANPVEVAIFVIVTAIFCESGYNLIYNQPLSATTTLTPMSSIPTSEGRSLASVSSPKNFLTFDVACDTINPFITQATKVRLQGQLCSSNVSTKSKRTLITNRSNQFSATVFEDIVNRKFSTDYIPLSSGDNKIQMEFSYLDGSTVTKEFVIKKD